MSSSSLRRQVLASFKKLHQTRKHVFQGDTFTLAESRKHINEKFTANKNQMDEAKIADLLKEAEEVEEVMRKTITQFVKTKEGHYRVVVRPELLLDNASPNEVMENEMIGTSNEKSGSFKENQ